ncbi:MAG: Mur ligase family protein [Acidobacteriota bacterium]
MTERSTIPTAESGSGRESKTAPLDIYCIAIGGSGMAPLACLLQALGHRVRGADGPLYPPMSTLLERAGIEPLVGYDGGHLENGPRPDLVVVGNAVPRDNPEAQAAERLGLPRVSMPEALGRFVLAGRQPLVVAGTHGKTTTSAMAAHALLACGVEPGFLIGGLPVDLDDSFRIGAGSRFVIEGDEYNAAYFDRGAKFLHYRPHTVVLTSVEHDHADLYPTPNDLLDAFRRLVALIPADGRLAACGDLPEVREVVRDASCEVVFYGLEDGNDVRPLAPPAFAADGTRVRLAAAGGTEVEVRLPLAGRHNLQNALGVWAALGADGLDPCQLAEALSSFHGTRRRQEELGTAAGVTVVDDFAHHPTAVGKTAEALRQLYPGRRLWLLFEPRSLTAGRSFFFDAYVEAFTAADGVLLGPIFHRGRLTAETALDRPALVSALRARGVEATAFDSTEALLAGALDRLRAGDVAASMSSGAFEDVPRRLLAALGEHAG